MRSLLSRRPQILVSMVAVLVAPLIFAAPAAAATTLSLSTSSVGVAPDFASQRYADQWDYANVEDLPLIPGLNGSGNSAMSYSADGTLSATVSRGGWLTLVTAVPGAIGYGRDGNAIPISADQYTRFSVRLWSDKANVAQVWWRTCADANPACYGAVQFETRPGWGVYDVALKKLPQTAAEWSGSIVGLQINPTGIADGRIAIDWTRLYQPMAADRVQVSQAGANAAGEILIDADRDPSNGNESTLRRDGSTVRVPANGSVTVDASMLPAGTWNVGVRTDSSGVVTYARSLVVTSTPMPVVIDPDIGGGADVHDVMGGSAWDFNQMSDIKALFSVQNASVVNGVFYGQNGGPNNWDPQVDLTMPGLIDGSRFHRVTLKVGYDGGWGLENAPGGGMMSRFIWQTNGNPAAYQDLNDVLVVPGDQTISFDLAADPATVIDSDTPTKIGWVGQLISSLRFDPNEDPSSARTWRIDDIRLAEDDRGSGSFGVRYQDANWAPGTVADIYVDRGAPGQNRTAVASGVPVTQGVNQFTWSLDGMPEGTYWVLVGMRRGDVSSSAFSTGPVQMTSSAAAQPRGSFDGAAQVGPDGVRVRGWALDPSNAGSVADVHVYVDGVGAALKATASRPDVGSAMGVGAQHGFDYTMTGVGGGSHTVCAYSIRNAGNRLLGCQRLDMAADPTGSVDSVTNVTGGVLVAGWALDRSTATSDDVHVYVDGRPAVASEARSSRPDVAAAFPGYGSDHGFSVMVPMGSGAHTVCVYALDEVAPGANALLDCRTVTVPAAPLGSLDVARRYGTSLTLNGWAMDPRSGGATGVHVYVDGVGRWIGATSSVRPDVLAAFPYRSSSQGFAATIGVTDAPHQVCVYAVGVEASALLSCRSV